MNSSPADILRAERCSLVVENKGEVRTYSRKGVRDLEYLIDNEPDFLRGASVADKVTGKASAGLAVYAGVAKLYSEILSRKALPLLEAAGIEYSFGTLVDRILIPEGDRRCPLEQIVDEARTPEEVVAVLRKHFEEKSGN